MTAAKIIATGIISIFTTVALLPAFLYYAMGQDGNVSTSILMLIFYLAATAYAATARTTKLACSRAIILLAAMLMIMPATMHFMTQRMLYLDYDDQTIFGALMINGGIPTTVLLIGISIVVALPVGLGTLMLGLFLKNGK